MKLYAIRNKETGKIVNDNYGHPHVRRCPEDVFDSRRDELVTLRIEPTEPCEKCVNKCTEIVPSKHSRFLAFIEPNFCSNCGRNLKDDPDH